jgi:hypothetical protein
MGKGWGRRTPTGRVVGAYVPEGYCYCRLRLLESQRLAHSDKRMLRVIVGKGSHSTGGEPILQRSTQNHLLGKSYKYELRGGMLIVHPKRT